MKPIISKTETSVLFLIDILAVAQVKNKNAYLLTF